MNLWRSLLSPLAAWLVPLAAGFGQATPFPEPYNSEPETAGRPMSAAEAAATMRLPSGFKASVFAAEPDVQNPIAMSWDGRGRLWIAENYTYAEAPRRFELGLRDRILIFEDKNHDGHFSSRKVFTDNLQMLTSLEVGRGGVWVMCPPTLLFIPVHNGSDAPDGPPEVVLDGFKVPQENYHNLANGLRFGPDGWLYGRVGHSAPAEVGAPGTPPEQRVPVRGGMWRYQPERKVFETLTAGTTNPWGHDWNEDGELFHVNTVNGHLWHVVAGEHFVAGTTMDPNPHVYGLIDMIADHWHFDTGMKWSESRAGAADAYGGGHSHIGAMVYLGDNWPAEYRGHLFTLNQHGRRANEEILERTGSGYVGHRGVDTLFSADPWFCGIDLSYGPDGGVYVLDWSNPGECHGRTGIDRTSGRIFKVTYGEPKAVEVGDLAKLSTVDLVKLHTLQNEWFSRRARVELTSRATAGQDLAEAKEQLRALLKEPGDDAIKLRVLWTLYCIGGTDDALLANLLRDPNEHLRTWAIRLLSDRWPLDTVLSRRPLWWPGAAEAEMSARKWQGELARLAREDSSGLVRLALASTLQRLPANQRAELAELLVAHREDAADHNLPWLVWYGLIPVADTEPTALVRLAARCELPLTRKCIARRLTEDIAQNPNPLNDLLEVTLAKGSADFANDILAGMYETLSGWRKAPKPEAWEALAQKLAALPGAPLEERVRELSAIFGDGRALDDIKKIALDNDADLNRRQAALRTLIENHAPDLRELCEKLIHVQFLNPLAAQGLAGFDDPAIGGAMIKAYREFHQSERPQLLAVLVSRPSLARALLAAVAAGKIPPGDLTPLLARQIRGLHDQALDQQLTQVWGELRDSPAEKLQTIAAFKAQLTPEALAKADKSAGRAVFVQTCAVCHRLYGEGAEIGPDLTGSGRSSLDYLLENIVDPSAVVAADYRMTIVSLADGRVLNGFVTAQNDRTLTLKTVTEKLTLARSDIRSTEESASSLMPEGLLQALPAERVRELIAYLMYPAQVPLPAPKVANP